MSEWKIKGTRRMEQDESDINYLWGHQLLNFNCVFTKKPRSAFAEITKLILFQVKGKNIHCLYISTFFVKSS